MANIKSAKKRILVNTKKNEQNTMIKSELKTIIKNFKIIVASGNKEEAQKMLSIVFAKLDMAAQKKLMHEKNASRKKSTLASLVSKMN